MQQQKFNGEQNLKIKLVSNDALLKEGATLFHLILLSVFFEGNDWEKKANSSSFPKQL